MLMPKAEGAILAQRKDLLTDLRAIVPGEGVIADEIALRAYESDGLSVYRQVPMAVVLPETVAQVSEIMKL